MVGILKQPDFVGVGILLRIPVRRKLLGNQHLGVAGAEDFFEGRHSPKRFRDAVFE